MTEEANFIIEPDTDGASVQVATTTGDDRTLVIRLPMDAGPVRIEGFYRDGKFPDQDCGTYRDPRDMRNTAADARQWRALCEGAKLVGKLLYAMGVRRDD